MFFFSLKIYLHFSHNKIICEDEKIEMVEWKRKKFKSTERKGWGKWTTFTVYIRNSTILQVRRKCEENFLFIDKLFSEWVWEKRLVEIDEAFYSFFHLIEFFHFFCFVEINFPFYFFIECRCVYWHKMGTKFDSYRHTKKIIIYGGCGKEIRIWTVRVII